MSNAESPPGEPAARRARSGWVEYSHGGSAGLQPKSPEGNALGAKVRGVEPDGDGAVVDELDCHLGAKATAFNVETER